MKIDLVLIGFLLAMSLVSCRGKKDRNTAGVAERKSAPVEYVDHLIADVQKAKNVQDKANNLTSRNSDDLDQATKEAE